jgi:hypothetical protein
VARVHLLSAASSGPNAPPKALLDLEQMREAAASDRFGVHTTAGDPDDADLILFVETSTAAGPYFERVRRHPVYRRAREHSYVFSSTDRVVPLVPGVFASIERSDYLEAWSRPGHYLGVRERGDIRYMPAVEPSLLFSFAGSTAASPVRAAVLALPTDDARLLDTAEAPLDQAAYADSIREAAFALCPRGGGTASFRLFEAMLLGRAPVIVSDGWVSPNGPDWDAFSVRVAESEVASIPAILRERAGDAATMGAAAHEAWSEWFAPEVSFHRTVESLLALDALGPRRRGAARLAPWAHMARPVHVARALRYRLGRD